MMDWLPPASDFRDRLRKARTCADPADRFARLARLAQCRLGFVEIIQLDRTLRELADAPVAGVTAIRFAVLSSSTVDHLLPAVRVAGLRRGLMIDAYTGAYGQYRQDLLDPSSGLHRFKPQTVLFSLSARDAISSIPLAATSTEAEAAVGQFVSGLQSLWAKTREACGASVIQQTFLDVAEPLFGSYDRLVPGAPSQLVARLNDQVSDAAAKDGVLVLDIARASQRDGLAAWFDTGRWLQGKLEISPFAAAMYGELTVRILAAQRGLSKKCLVLDLDNTLWGGVIGDDGLGGIVLGEGSAAGEAHLALQRYAKQLNERGIILAVCSKNDPQIAEAAFHDHPEMILKRSDIAAFVANWSDKSENLQAIAKRLNIGIDSLVFVDDNPVERARIRESLPAVSVPELPEDVAGYVRCLANAGYFEAVAFTSEDRERAGQYVANAERDALMGAAQSMEEFLRGLGMSVVFGPFTPADLPRVAQLINKTNQFNTTTRRYSGEEISGLTKASECMTFQFRLRDRFGDNGIVSTMILRPAAQSNDELEIENWVMSCRVFGRELEFEAMNIAVEAARQRGVRSLRAHYIPTKKNAVIKELYENLGFRPLENGGAADGRTCWSLPLAEYAARNTQIARQGHTE